MKAYNVLLKKTRISFHIHGWSDKGSGFIHGCFSNGERSSYHIVDIIDFEPEEVDKVHAENYSHKPLTPFFPVCFG